jgi:ATP-dependent Lon protease
VKHDAALALGAARINPLLCTLNRLALLHGPPGTGKTSLCHGVAQSLA